MGFLSDAWDSVSDAADSVADVAGDVAGAAADMVVEAGEAAVDVAGNVGGVVGDVWGTGFSVADMASGGTLGDALDLVDDTVLDTVDYVTGGVIDLDYEQGGFTAALGIDDVISAGVSVGEDGISTDGQVINQQMGVGLTDDGLSVTGTAGIDWGPLPYADGHVKITPDGDVDINGEIQGTLPTPYGLFSGDVKGGFVRTDEGWGAFHESDGSWTLPSGVTIRGGLDGSYVETEHGSHASIGVEGSVEYMGMGVGHSAGYERLEQDGDVIEGAHFEGYAQGMGAEVRAGADYTGMEVDGVKRSDWSGDVDAEGLDAGSVLAIGQVVLGEAGVELPDSVDGLVDVLGEGGTSDLLGTLVGDGSLDGFVAGLGGGGAAQFIDKAVGDGVVGDLVQGLGADAAAGLVGKMVESGEVANLMGSLDSDQATELLIKVASAGSVVAPPPTDDVLATDVLTAPIPGAGGGIDEPMTDPLGGDLGAVDVTEDAVLTDDIAPIADETMVVDDVVAPAPEPPPLDEFDQQIAAADQAEDSIDDLFDDL